MSTVEESVAMTRYLYPTVGHSRINQLQLILCLLVQLLLTNGFMPRKTFVLCYGAR